MDNGENNNDDGGSVVETVANLDLDEDNVNLDFSGYEDMEIAHIKEVLQMDKSLRQEERQRKKKVEDTLDQTIMSIEMKNVDSGEKFCLVCGEKFAMLINPRKVCIICEKGACNLCLYKLYTDNQLMCKLCYLICTRDGKTGKWFNSLSKNNGRFRRNAPIIIMNSLRRIKAKFTTTPDIEVEHPPIRPAPIRSIENGDVHQPMYLTKKNSPKPPRKSKVEKEALNIQGEATEMVSVYYDEGDGREMEVGANNIAREIHNGARLEVEEPDMNHLSPRSNLGSMTSLYSSTMSVYSETYESYNAGIMPTGEISFYVNYQEQTRLLSVYVEQCRNIAVADTKKQRTDPYIKTYLLPDKTKISKKKSAVLKSTLNPVFKETMTYYIDASDITSRNLSIAVWHKSSMLKYNIFLGEVQLVLANLDLDSQDCQWMQLHEKRKYPIRSAGFLFKGEIMIRLKYKGSARKDGKGSLHAFIVGAKNLQSDRQSINSYVKGYLLPNKDRKSKQKTNILKHTLNPTWNCLLQFQDVGLEDLKDRSLELSIYHQNKLKVNEFLGGVRLNLGLGLHSSQHVQWMDAQGAEKEAWEQFLANPNECTDVTLNLRANLDF